MNTNEITARCTSIEAVARTSRELMNIISRTQFQGDTRKRATGFGRRCLKPTPRANETSSFISESATVTKFPESLLRRRGYAGRLRRYFGASAALIMVLFMLMVEVNSMEQQSMGVPLEKLKKLGDVLYAANRKSHKEICFFISWMAKLALENTHDESIKDLNLTFEVVTANPARPHTALRVTAQDGTVCIWDFQQRRDELELHGDINNPSAVHFFEDRQETYGASRLDGVSLRTNAAYKGYSIPLLLEGELHSYCNGDASDGVPYCEEEYIETLDRFLTHPDLGFILDFDTSFDLYTNLLVKPGYKDL